MKIGKYDIPAGSGTKPNTGTTALAGSGSNVDLTPITDKVAALESRVSQLELQLSKALAALAGLDSKFLSKFGDRSEYSYALGALYTDFVQSGMYDNGVGFRVSGSPTATVEDKYNLIIKDVGWARVAFATIQQAEATIVDSNTDEATDQLNASNVSIGAAAAAGYLLVDCGATMTNERLFTVISKSVEYSVKTRIGDQIDISGFTEAETDSNGYFILHFPNADEVSITIRFKFAYAFRKFADLTSGTYRLYIRGTDAANNRTDCFAASSKTATLNASGVTIVNGQNGYRITSNGVQHTTDGGTTWT